MKLRDLFATYTNQLLKLYPKQEAESLVYWLFDEFLQLKRFDVLRSQKIIAKPKEMEEALEMLLSGIPLQYILGKAPFYGREFKVSSAVLIPRNETEELVHLIIRENPNSGLKILDIGTGSGCIPITLDLEMAQTSLYACDISQSALDVAKENGRSLNATVEYFKLDILNEDIPFRDLDIIVSNPPYIKTSEKRLMHKNVLENEPHLALFVPEEDPLVFYRNIGVKGLKALKNGGKIYFEINETLAGKTRLLLEDIGYKNVRVLKDINDKERMLVAFYE